MKRATLPQELGSLSILLHAGSWPDAPVFPLPAPTGKGIPIIGSVGTNDPAIWRHVIWFDGLAFTAVLKCDLRGYHSTPQSLALHYATHPQCWKALTP